MYRVVARTSDPDLSIASIGTGGYSIDNLPPPAPQAALQEIPGGCIITWDAPEIPDLASACVYRGPIAGDALGGPVHCPEAGRFVDTAAGSHSYFVRFTDTHGNVGPWSFELGRLSSTAVPAGMTTLPMLGPNTPNPFNPVTMIPFELPRPGAVRVAIYDVGGRCLVTLADAHLEAGRHVRTWDGRDDAGRAMGSGAYFARLDFDDRTETIGMLLVR
jgi:hypothetical protein